MRTRVGLVSLVAACVVLAGCGGSGDPVGQPGTTTVDTRSAEGTPADAAREPAPAIAGQSLEGEPVTLADFRGRPVLLNVWSSW